MIHNLKQNWHIALSLLGVALLVALYAMGIFAPADLGIGGIALAGTTLSARYPTLLDVTRALDPDGRIAQIGEVLNETNDILDDMVWKEGNLPTGHRGAIRAGLPEPTWRKLYGGVQPTKSRVVQVTDACGMLEAYAEVDKKLVDLSGDPMGFRFSEDRAHIEGMSQALVDTLFYGNELVESEKFTGFAPRFNDQSADNGRNILTSAATPDSSDNASIWLIVWGDNVHGIYPKGSKAGLSVEDKGVVTLEAAPDGSGGRMEAYRSHYSWDAGLHVKDWRYVVRINIDQEDLVKDAASGPDLLDLLAQAVDLVPNIGAGRPVFYANRTVRGFIRRQITNKVAGSTLSIEQITRANGAHLRVPMFDGIPIRRCDALLNTEAGI